jgi:hypothetical protein
LFRANRILSRFGRLDYSVRLNLSVKVVDSVKLGGRDIEGWTRLAATLLAQLVNNVGW